MLKKLFNKLGYNSQNGLYILEESEKLILDKFPSRISRVLTEVIKPYAVFSVDIQYEKDDHVKPFNNPLILFYDNPSKEQYDLIPKHSFNLSRSPIIIINRENKIEIFNGFDFSDKNREWLESIDIDLDLLSIKNLRSGKGWKEIYNQFFSKIKTVDRFLLSNITDARRILIAKETDFPSGNLSPEVANRLIGRLIFIRYLIDRNVAFNDQNILIGTSKKERQEALNFLLLDHEKTYAFFEYISNKFKGDLFPLKFENQGLPFLEKDYVRKENLLVLYHLLTCSNMFVGNRVRGYSVQPSLFNIYDFEIIPVELISNIYESFLGNTIFSKGKMVTELSKQKEVKAYYTPPFLVDYVLSQTVHPFLLKSNKADCKVLDPSCGSGIFLVESLRQIIDKEVKLKLNSNNLINERISNQRLWELLEKNIFGIDIDQNAIEITIFSLYITLLDYKTHPREIENFEFRPLKGSNLFGGIEADFFNLNNPFNNIFKTKSQLNFIVGNPPWGIVNKSSYVEYISKRAKSEKKENTKLDLSLAIGNKEISQAFMLRVSDLIQKDADTKICLIVTGKNLYNSDQNALKWRKYFLTKFNIIQCFDLFGVNNKVAGGKQIFDNANQPPVILLYELKRNNSTNIIKHIVARANLYYHYFRTVVVEKNDVKLINQNLFIENDKLWKIMLYGNSLDYLFVKKIKKDCPTILDVMDNYGLELKGGYKSKDSSIPIEKRKDTNHLWDFDYVEVETSKDLGQYYVNSKKPFKDKLEELSLKGIINFDLKVPQVPGINVFTGTKLLLKKGLDQYLNHRAVSAVSTSNCVFSSTVASISVSENHVLDKEIENILYAMATIFNSRLFLYNLLMTSSSFGAGRNRVNFTEFLDMPFIMDKELADYSKSIHELTKINDLKLNTQKIEILEEKIEEKIYELYEVNIIERELINYAIDVSIPIIKRADRSNPILPYIFRQVSKKDINIIEKYCIVFVDHFSKRFNKSNNYFGVDVYMNEDFIALNFIITKKRNETIKYHFNSNLDGVINKIGNLGINNISTDLFVQQDIRGFNKNSFYIMKPNIIKNWHLSLAYSDLTEFIEAIAKSEIKNVKQN
ncbi:Eco57I restriction-modification methylase domain-containing protein [Winogradskyella eximia]|uniref:Eco57I restriction-modification methylase domain-containing protein n=1 Tax=Winogradskyella eximia TaxID=262006 RepID=UPI0024916FF5|nr:DNA methyltransferase [Winogradskyella eximia]